MAPESGYLERETKLSATLGFELPDLHHAAGRRQWLAEEDLRSRYFDTPDLRLWSRGVTLRRQAEGGSPRRAFRPDSSPWWNNNANKTADASGALRLRNSRRNGIGAGRRTFPATRRKFGLSGTQSGSGRLTDLRRREVVRRRGWHRPGCLELTFVHRPIQGGTCGQGTQHQGSKEAVQEIVRVCPANGSTRSRTRRTPETRWRGSLSTGPLRNRRRFAPP